MGRGRTASSPKLNGVGLAKTFILSHCRLIVRRVTERPKLQQQEPEQFECMLRPLKKFLAYDYDLMC